MSNPLAEPKQTDSETTQKKGLRVLLTGNAARGKRAHVAMMFMAAAGMMLLAFILGATWYNGGQELPIDTAWAEQTFDKVLVAFLGMLAFTRASAVR